MKAVATFLLLISSITIQAQFGKDPIINLENMDKKIITWGYYLGFNSYDFRFDYKTAVKTDIKTSTSTGFNVGLVGDVRINDYFNIRIEPGLSSNIRTLYFPDITNAVKAKREVASTYIHMPLLLKTSTVRVGNIKPFILTGISTALNLSSNYNASEDNSSGKFRSTRFTNYYELGFGIDLYFEYFKFSPSIRGIFSTQDELIRDQNPSSQWTGNIEQMQTRGVFVNFTFQ